MQRTRTQQASYLRSYLRAADAGRYALSSVMKSLLIVTSTVILLIAQPSFIGQAQTAGWRVYSPPNQSFSVKSPAPLRKVESFSGEHNASLERSQKNHWASCYAAIETTPEDSRFGIIVINARQKFIRSQPRDEPDGLYWYLGAILIGNEDETKPTSVKGINVNRLKGKEYVYTHGGVSTRGRIFEIGGKIYVVVFVGKDDQDLTSSDAERFLNSFRLHGWDRK